MITDVEAAERLHPVEDPSEHWSDSLYFNAWDPGSGTFFLTRIGVHANRPSINALFLAWLDGEPSYAYYRELDHKPESDWDRMQVEGLSFRMVRVGRDWSLHLADGENQGSLAWEGFTELFDYADNAQPLPKPVAWGHYEQTGRVRGDLFLNGRTLLFDGVGQRDHSWGFRDWAGVKEWHWVTGFLGEGRSFNLFHVIAPDGTVTANGFVHDAGENLAIVEVDRVVDTTETGAPESYRLGVTVRGGRRFSIEGTREGTGVPLKPGTTTVHEVPMTLSCDGVKGFGVYELLTQA
jgi:hypothetical protein